jgi:hypothetical protein
MNPILTFLWGCLSISSGVAGLLFFRFWKDARDRLFLHFAVAFWTLAVHWVLLAMVQPVNEHVHFVFSLRMVAFTVLALGIWDKNRRR